ncbi:MAG: phasin family protein [Sulfitobacter sp.]
MTDRTQREDIPKAAEPPAAAPRLQQAGFGNMTGLGAAWIEVLSDMNAEVVGFLAERIKEDVKTQHEILHCKDAAELNRIQSKFIQRATDQYRAETGKLVELGSKAFRSDSK